jgi:hypothetical protein
MCLIKALKVKLLFSFIFLNVYNLSAQNANDSLWLNVSYCKSPKVEMCYIINAEKFCCESGKSTVMQVKVAKSSLFKQSYLNIEKVDATLSDILTKKTWSPVYEGLRLIGINYEFKHVELYFHYVDINQQIQALTVNIAN